MQHRVTGNNASECKLVQLQDVDFAGDLTDSKTTPARICANLVDMQKKQTAVWQSSTEAEIMSLGAGLRKEGTSALSLWDTVIDVLQC